MNKKDRLAIIHQHYPDALTTADTVKVLVSFVEESLQLEPAQVLLADSICSDDVNSIQYPLQNSDFLGPFKLGGLDGIPFTGLTGMGAFASHVPDDGAIFIYYGPHIGVPKAGPLGEILRFGQHKNSGSCGAAKGALAKLTNNAITEGKVNDDDYQMNSIEQLLLKHKERILQAENPLKETTEVIYETTDERIQELVAKTNYNCQYVILMGVVLINGDRDMGSFNSVRRFDVINIATQERKDLKSAYFS